MAAVDTALVIMAKQPEGEKTKTRLCPPLQPEQAAAFYEAMLLDSMQLVTILDGCDLAVAITPAGAAAYFKRITPPGALLLPVSGADIGACLAQALGALLGRGYRKVFALNADGPSLPLEYLEQAKRLLDEYDLVIGPAQDGGYYLIGMKELHPELFRGIAWSSERVCSQTLERAQQLALQAALTPEWYDVDTAQDMLRLQNELARLPADRLVNTRRFLKDFKGGRF
jgi:rSAM/selenodomain-associated transferase 1